MRTKLEKDQRGWMLRVWCSDYSECAYFTLRWEGPRLQFQIPSDWHEHRRAWFNIGLGFGSANISFPWRWRVVPDDGQCSGPTYGFYVFDGDLVLQWGKSHGRRNDPRKHLTFPWRDWRFQRLSLYDKKGEHFATEHQKSRWAWGASSAVKDACPKVQFEFDDYDGERIIATTHIEEREWKLRWFPLTKIRRALSLEFNKEVGPEKGSWKGGTLGHGIDMLPGELHEGAFRRYCGELHRSKYRKFSITYVDRVPDPPIPTDPQCAAGAA